MPRANRCYLPGHAWHITHRCHGQEFLLRASDDRSRWRCWLAEASARYGVSVLNFIVTSNHIHLLIHDGSGNGGVARLMQLVQGRTAQSYNRRNERRGAYWQDRYRAVAVETGQHLWRCITYIDLNMVRAGVVRHPIDWAHAGYHEIQSSSPARRILDLECLAELTGCSSLDELRESHRDQVEGLLDMRQLERQPDWTEAIAIGSEAFAESVRSGLGVSRLRRLTTIDGNTYTLRESRAKYIG